MPAVKKELDGSIPVEIERKEMEVSLNVKPDLSQLFPDLPPYVIPFDGEDEYEDKPPVKANHVADLDCAISK